MRQEPHATQLIQIALHTMGYDVIVDGVWGPKTQGAFDSYVSKNTDVRSFALKQEERPWHRVLATHEEEQQLARGAWLGDNFPGVALPCKEAYGKWVDIMYNDKITVAQVVDIGPWCIDDNDYVFGCSRPRAEILKGQPMAITRNGSRMPTVPDGKGGMKEVARSNGAGIDIFNRVAKELGIKNGENVMVAWRWAVEEKWPYQF